MPEEELFDLARRLGADVPICLAGRAAFADDSGLVVDALGGVDLMIQLQIGGVEDLRADDIYAAKKLRL